jgi:hypothetical protein
MAHPDETRGARPSDPAEGAAPDEDANSPARQRESVQAETTTEQPADEDSATAEE